MDQEHRRNKPDKEHSERTGLNNGRLRREENSARRRAYSEGYTITVQPVNKKHLHSTTTIQLHLTAADYQRIRQDLASEFFLNKTTRVYARGLGQHHRLINTKLGNPALISTTPGGSEPKTKDKKYKKLKTTTTTTHQDFFNRLLFQKKRTRRRHEAAGYIAPEFFEDRNLDPPTFASKSKRLGGYTQ